LIINLYQETFRALLQHCEKIRRRNSELIMMRH